MLTEEETRQIQQVITQHHDKRSACIEAMSTVQRQHGFLSDEHLEQLATLLDMTAGELDSLATFYNYIYRKPTGQHVISVCDSLSCWITGYDRIRKHLERRLGIKSGQTTPDGRFTLLPEPCLGACDQAPAMMIDGELIGKLTEDKIDQALESIQS